MVVKKIKNIKCVIVSLDETLYDNSKKIILSNKKVKSVIIDFIKNNHYFIIRNNYNLTDVKQVYNEIGIINFCRYSMVCSGNVIYDNQGNRQLSHRYLTRSVVQRAQDIQKEFELKNYPILLTGYDGVDEIRFFKSPFLTQGSFKKYISDNKEFESNNYSLVTALVDKLPLVKLVWKVIDPKYLKMTTKDSSPAKVDIKNIQNDIIEKYQDSVIKPLIYLGTNGDTVELNMARIDDGSPVKELIKAVPTFSNLEVENFAIIGFNGSDLDVMDRVKNIIVNKPRHPDIIKKADIVLNESLSNFLLKALSLIE